MTAITDKFGKASIETNYALATTVKTARTVGESVLACYDLSRFSQSTPVFFVTYKKTTNPTTNEVSVTNQTSWKAIVNPDNNTLTNLTLAPGYTDIGNDIGDFVECIPTSFWGNELIDGILVSHNPDGTIKNKAVPLGGINGGATDGVLQTVGGVVSATGAWTTWTPTFSGITVGNGALTAAYSRVGKTVNFRVALQFGTTTSITAAFPTFTLPVTSRTTGSNTGTVIYQFLDTSVAYYYGQIYIGSNATAVAVTVTNTGGTYATEHGVSSTVPFTFGSSDWIYAVGVYEAA